jgi:uncharacterized protein YoxC
MDVILFIVGAITAGVIGFLFFRKKIDAAKINLEKAERTFSDQEKKNRIEMDVLERELKLKIDKINVLVEEINDENDKNETLNQEILKSKKVSQSLNDENENYSSTIREYEMLFNAKKDEIAKLKRQLNK